MTTLCLQLDGSYKTPIIFFYSENNSETLNRPPNTNLYTVQRLFTFRQQATGNGKPPPPPPLSESVRKWNASTLLPPEIIGKFKTVMIRMILDPI